jgi:hypothetical protein
MVTVTLGGAGGASSVMAPLGTALNNTGLRKNNFAGSIAPVATDDTSAGYEAGSLWVLPASGRTFVARSVAAGAAVWAEVLMVGASQAWSNVTGTPTTLAGYGIADAQPLDADLTAIAAQVATTNNILQSSGSAWASRTPTQVTATLDTMTSALKGLAPASGGGTVNFLRADGTWAVPPGGGGGVSDGDKGDVVVSGAGTVWALDYAAVNAVVAPVFANVTAKPTSVSGYGITDAVTTAGNQTVAGTKTFSAPAVLAGQTTDPASPGDGTLWHDSQIDTAKVVLGSRSKDLVSDWVHGPYVWKASPGAATISAVGLGGPTAVGTATLVNIATTNKVSMTPRLEYLVTTASTTAVAGFRGTNNVVSVGGAAADLGGFRATVVWGPATGVATTTMRAFAGLANVTSAPTDVEPSTTVSCVAMGWDAADANVQMMFNDASGTCTKVSLGASFVVPTTDRTALYKMELYSPKGTTQSVQWRVTDMVSGAVAQGTQTTDLPTTATLLAQRGWVSVGGTSSVVGFGLSSFYLDPLL